MTHLQASPQKPHKDNRGRSPCAASGAAKDAIKGLQRAFVLVRRTSVSHPADGKVKSQKAERDEDEAERDGEEARVCFQR